jgi:adenosyl cobinamide kinase/adenosyl cobinamide phosphate guanylyltransferase
MGITFLTGGARSGKSDLAMKLASKHGDSVTFVATAEALDDDMADRIQRHRAERPEGWTTVESPIELQAALESASGTVIVDCLTLWVTNLMLAEHPDDEILERARAAAKVAATLDAIAVTNEVGDGVHPPTELGRRFRDLLGRVNRIWADEAEVALLVVAGRVLPLQDHSSIWGATS